MAKCEVCGKELLQFEPIDGEHLILEGYVTVVRFDGSSCVACWKCAPKLIDQILRESTH